VEVVEAELQTKALHNPDYWIGSGGSAMRTRVSTQEFRRPNLKLRLSSLELLEAP